MAKLIKKANNGGTVDPPKSPKGSEHRKYSDNKDYEYRQQNSKRKNPNSYDDDVAYNKKGGHTSNVEAAAKKAGISVSAYLERKERAKYRPDTSSKSDNTKTPRVIRK